MTTENNDPFCEELDQFLATDETKVIPKGIDFKRLAEDMEQKREEDDRRAALKKQEAERPIILSEDQERAMNAAEKGYNILITGSAGTGKSELHKQLVRKLDDGFGAMVTTASTGIAAVNVGGVTINSFAGLGLGDLSQEETLRKVKERGRVVQRLRDVRRLAIDEISMVSADLLQKLDYVLRHVRDRIAAPFGGVQIIAYGDFLQLPPVNGDFAFESEVWQRANFKVALLKKVFRQTDLEFSSALNDFRVANISAAATKLFGSRLNAPDNDPAFEPVDIYTTNVDVEKFNTDRLAKIEEPETIYEASDWGDEWDVQALDRNCLAPKTLRLKVGAQVMLLANLDVSTGLANGTIGKVIKLPDPAKKGWKCGPTVLFRNGAQRVLDRWKWEIKMGGDVIAERTQIPLRLAWAITAHKSQGMTLDKARVHLANVFADGQAYVALSRARTLDGLFIANTRKGVVTANRKALAFYEEAVTL